MALLRRMQGFLVKNFGVYVYTYICVYVYMRIYIYIYIRIYIYIYIHIYLHIYTGGSPGAGAACGKTAGNARER